jgi:hypothetical protein
MVEGPEAWKRFEGVMKTILAVPRSELQKRIKDRQEAASNPGQRRLKRTAKPLASPNPDA